MRIVPRHRRSSIAVGTMNIAVVVCVGAAAARGRPSSPNRGGGANHSPTPPPPPPPPGAPDQKEPAVSASAHYEGRVVFHRVPRRAIRCSARRKYPALAHHSDRSSVARIQVGNRPRALRHPHATGAYFQGRFSRQPGAHVPKVITTLHGTESRCRERPSYSETVEFRSSNPTASRRVSESWKRETYQSCAEARHQGDPNFLECDRHKKRDCRTSRAAVSAGPVVFFLRQTHHPSLELPSGGSSVRAVHRYFQRVRADAGPAHYFVGRVRSEQACGWRTRRISACDVEAWRNGLRWCR